jgi:hypothetical protein
VKAVGKRKVKMKKFTTDSTEGYEHELMRISRELHEVAKAIEQIGDHIAAGDLMHLERMVSGFATNPALRTRQGGKRTVREWIEYNEFALNNSRVYQKTAEVILRSLEAAVEEKEEVKK